MQLAHSWVTVAVMQPATRPASLLLRDRATAFDAALALALTTLAQLQAWTDEAAPDPRELTAATLVLVTAPLAWRRRAPLAALAALMAGFAAPTLYAETSLQGPALLGAVLVGVYSVAAYCDRRGALTGFGLAVLGTGIHELRAGIKEEDPWGAAFFWLLIAGAWVVGRYSRRHREATALAERAARLERERDEHARAAIAEERARIARELHDVVAHAVSVIVLQAEAGEEVLDRQPARAGEPLRKIQRTGREALGEMRRLLGVLRQDGHGGELAPQPGVARLGALAAQAREAGMTVDLRVEGEAQALAPGIDLTAYRVVQEALTNVGKHAGPAQAEVVVRYSEAGIELEITDDGNGARSGAGVGHGLVGMRERVQLSGGELETGPLPGRGYRVRARLPLA
jgi:signal transduction histidine kinase